jgi:hypothetical protein
MLTHDQARELVAYQLALNFRVHNSGELIQREIEREWGWVFLYPDYGGGPECGWLVNRHTREMKHVPAISLTEESLVEYGRGGWDTKLNGDACAPG